MVDLIETFEEALANAHAFQGVSEHTDSRAFVNIDHFFHWYYFPDHDIFAPAKFIGFRHGSVAEYTSHGVHVHEAQEVLSQWFDRLAPEGPDFAEVQAKLANFMDTLGANLHVQSRETPGGIYIPRGE